MIIDREQDRDQGLQRANAEEYIARDRESVCSDACFALSG